MAHDNRPLTTVVMVDDDEDDVMMLRTAVRRNGMDIRIVHMPEGRDLIHAFNQSSLPEPCVVLLDLNMPHMDGFNVLERVRNSPGGELLPIVVYTSSADQVQVEKAYSNGANAYLTKPSTLEDTRQMMGALVSHWLVFGRVPAQRNTVNEVLNKNEEPPQGDLKPVSVLIAENADDVGREIQTSFTSDVYKYNVDVVVNLSMMMTMANNMDYDVWVMRHAIFDATAEEILQNFPRSIRKPAIVILDAPKDAQAIARYNALGVYDFIRSEEYRPMVLERTVRFALAQWQSRQALAKNKEALLRSERMATIGRMATGIAHEYNNLNAVILAGLETIQKQCRLDGLAPEILRRIIASVGGSRRISNSLMTLGQNSQAEEQQVDIRSVLYDMISLLKMRGSKTGISVELEMPDDPCMAIVNVNDLHQIISNVTQNAFHAVHRSEQPMVRLKLQELMNKYVITITDNGVGIPEEDISKVCQPFFSRKGAKNTMGLFDPSVEGTGLGLSICQSLVERIDGTLSISSSLGFGTKVSITIKKHISASAPVITHSGDDGVKDQTEKSQIKRIVIVDDNSDLGELITDALSTPEFTPILYTDPLRFIAEHELDEIDVLILDWQMPGLSGKEVLERLADEKRASPIHVLISSGEHVEWKENIPGVTILGILAKPFRISELLGRIRGHE